MGLLPSHRTARDLEAKRSVGSTGDPDVAGTEEGTDGARLLGQ